MSKGETLQDEVHNSIVEKHPTVLIVHKSNAVLLFIVLDGGAVDHVV